MSVEVIADCDQCHDSIGLEGEDKIFCQKCHDRIVEVLELLVTQLRRELADVRLELETAQETIDELEQSSHGSLG